MRNNGRLAKLEAATPVAADDGMIDVITTHWVDDRIWSTKEHRPLLPGDDDKPDIWVDLDGGPMMRNHSRLAKLEQQAQPVKERQIFVIHDGDDLPTIGADDLLLTIRYRSGHAQQ